MDGEAQWRTALQGSSRRDEDVAAALRDNDDPHLRSIEAITGIISRERRRGWHVDDFLVEESTGAFITCGRYEELVAGEKVSFPTIDTGNRLTDNW